MLLHCLTRKHQHFSGPSPWILETSKFLGPELKLSRKGHRPGTHTRIFAGGKGVLVGSSPQAENHCVMHKDVTYCLAWLIMNVYEI